jgi:arginine/lysine/ornithine decarboxylase
VPDQRETPLATAAEAYLANERVAPFTTPGHKRAAHLVDPFLVQDLPLQSGADDFHLTGDLLGRAELLAADLWGAERCWFCVNGTTQGNEALSLAIARPGDRVIASRNLHKSLFAGFVLAGLEPVWVRPDIDADTGVPLGIPAARIEDALAKAPDARAVVLVEPSYVGVVSDVAAIADAAHARGIPLVVDQAWGAHFGLPPGRPALGALARRGRDGDLGAQDPRLVHARRLPLHARGAPRPRPRGRELRGLHDDEPVAPRSMRASTAPARCSRPAATSSSARPSGSPAAPARGLPP